MIDHFKQYVDGVGVIELQEVKFFNNKRVGITLLVHGDPMRLDLVTTTAKKLDDLRFICKNVQKKTLEIHFINHDDLPFINKDHPFVKTLMEGIKSKTKHRSGRLVQTGRFTRPADFD